jgi:hypothetical protein
MRGSYDRWHGIGRGWIVSFPGGSSRTDLNSSIPLRPSSAVVGENETIARSS